MDHLKFFDSYEKHLAEISKYRKDYLDTIIEKYVNTDDPGFVIDIRTLTVVQSESKEVKNVRIPAYGSLSSSYSCKAAQQLVKELSSLTFQGHEASEKKIFTCAQQLVIKSRNVENKDPDRAQQLVIKSRNVENKDPDRGKKIATPIAVRKNPKFKRDVNFFPDKSIPIDDCSLKSSSFSEISNNSKRVSSASNSNGDTGNEELDSVTKQRKGKKISTTIAVRKNPEFKEDLNFVPHKTIPVCDFFRKSSSFSEISNNNKNAYSTSNSDFVTDNKELDSVDKQRRDKWIDRVDREQKQSYVDKLRKRKKIATPITVQKNPKFKRDVNFLPYEIIPVDDCSLRSSSFSEISKNTKNVSSTSDSNGDTINEELDSVDKQRKNKYPFKINCNSEISCTSLTANTVQKWQARQNDLEEIVVYNSKTSYAFNRTNCRSSVLNFKHYKELESVNKQRSDECSAKFHCETLCTIRGAKLRNRYYCKPQIYQNSCRDDYEQMDFLGKQKIDECPSKSAFNNGLSIINYASRSSNDVHYVKKLKNKRRTHLDLISTYTKNVFQNMVCNNNILKIPHVTLAK